MEEMYYKIKTNKDIQTTMHDLKKSMDKNGFSVVVELDFKDRMAQDGITFDHNFKMIEICRAEYLKKVLDQSLIAGLMMPCKIGVLEDQGSVYIGMVKFTKMFGMMQNPALDEFLTKVEKEVLTAIEEAAK